MYLNFYFLAKCRQIIVKCSRLSTLFCWPFWEAFQALVVGYLGSFKFKKLMENGMYVQFYTEIHVYAYTRESVMMEFQGEFWKVERIQK